MHPEGHRRHWAWGWARCARWPQRLGLRFALPGDHRGGHQRQGLHLRHAGEPSCGRPATSTGVYTSPHLVHFEERLRSARRAGGLLTALVAAFAAVEQRQVPKRRKVSLTYSRVHHAGHSSRRMAQAGLDVVILEVGLGGRLDAVNIIDTDCAIITSIDLDHMELLGNDREAIGFEKAGIMRTGRPVVVSDPVPPPSVLDRALEVGADLWQRGPRLQCVRRQAAVGLGRARAPLQRAGLPGAARRQPAGQRRGRAGRTDGPARAPAGHGAGGAQRAWLLWSCPGASRSFRASPALVLDVAHNPHSVAALAANLDAMGFFPTTHAVLAPWPTRTWQPMLARGRPDDRPLVFHRPAHARAPPAAPACRPSGKPPKHPQRRIGHQAHARPHAGAGRGHSRGRPR